MTRRHFPILAGVLNTAAVTAVITTATRRPPIPLPALSAGYCFDLTIVRAVRRWTRPPTYRACSCSTVCALPPAAPSVPPLPHTRRGCLVGDTHPVWAHGVDDTYTEPAEPTGPAGPAGLFRVVISVLVPGLARGWGVPRGGSASVVCDPRRMCTAVSVSVPSLLGVVS
jgi:hypothetical protein